MFIKEILKQKKTCIFFPGEKKNQLNYREFFSFEKNFRYFTLEELCFIQTKIERDRKNEDYSTFCFGRWI